MSDPSQMSQILEALRVQLEQQVAGLHERRRQLQASMEADVETANQHVQSQREVLENLRYEAEVLTEKLMKLRSNRQDIEAELFQLKDKRIRLLEDINKLEDEEMQLVSEVSRIIHFKKTLLKEVPCFEARARAAASLAVVQEYLQASICHLQEHVPQQGTDATTNTVKAAAPNWWGTANVRRPSANWITVPPTPQGSSISPTPGSTNSSLPPTPGLASEPSTASDLTRAGSSAPGLASAGTSTAAGLNAAAGTAEAVERLRLSSGGGAAARVTATQQAQQQEPQDDSPFAAIAAGQLSQLQPDEAAPADSLPTVSEGRSSMTPDALNTPLSSADVALSPRALQTLVPGQHSSGSYTYALSSQASGGRDSMTGTSKTSAYAGSSLTSRGGGSMPRRSDSGVPQTVGSPSTGPFSFGTNTFSGLPAGAQEGRQSAVGDAASTSAAATAAGANTQAQLQQQWSGGRPASLQPGFASAGVPPPPPPPRRPPLHSAPHGRMGQHSPGQHSPLAAAAAHQQLQLQQGLALRLQPQPPPPLSPQNQQQSMQLPQLVQAPAASMFGQPGSEVSHHQVQLQVPQSPQGLVVVQSPSSGDHGLQFDVPQLQLQLAQMQQNHQQQQRQQQQHQAAQQQQPTQQVLLLGDQLGLPTSMSLQPTSFGLSIGSNSNVDIDLGAGLASAAMQASSSQQGMWGFPTNAVLLHTDTAKVQPQGLPSMLSLQDLQQQRTNTAAAASAGGAGTPASPMGAAMAGGVLQLQPQLQPQLQQQLLLLEQLQQLQSQQQPQQQLHGQPNGMDNTLHEADQ